MKKSHSCFNGSFAVGRKRAQWWAKEQEIQREYAHSTADGKMDATKLFSFFNPLTQGAFC